MSCQINNQTASVAFNKSNCFSGYLCNGGFFSTWARNEMSKCTTHVTIHSVSCYRIIKSIHICKKTFLNGRLAGQMCLFCTMAEQHSCFLNHALVVASSVQGHFSLVLAKQKKKMKQTNKRTWSTHIQNKKTFFSSPSSVILKWTKALWYDCHKCTAYLLGSAWKILFLTWSMF